MRITFGRSGAWRTPVGGPQPAASKQASRQTAISQRSRKRVRRRVLGRFLIAYPMRWRLYSTADSPWGGCRERPHAVAPVSPLRMSRPRSLSAPTARIGTTSSSVAPLSSPSHPVLYRWALLTQDARHEENVEAFSVKLRDETDLGALRYDSTSEEWEAALGDGVREVHFEWGTGQAPRGRDCLTRSVLWLRTTSRGCVGARSGVRVSPVRE